MIYHICSVTDLLQSGTLSSPFDLFQEGSRDRGRRLFSLANLKSGKDKMMFVFEGDIELS